jgi:RHS repeat-associated protein
MRARGFDPSPIGAASLAGETARAFLHDAAGNIVEDTRGGHVYRYGYDANDRLATVTRDGVLWATYLYNGFGQLMSRELTAATGTPGTIHYSYDRDGRLIAETDADTGATLREYIWLEDLPVAVIDAAGLYHVVTDHLYRPVALFDSSSAEVWSAVWEPFGALYSVNGSTDLDARFPGQWYQLETGLHYNWHRHYDPTLGRYTQPDPVGMPDGPNRFVYALNDPLLYIDETGEFIAPIIIGGLLGGGLDLAMQYMTNGCIDWWQVGASAAVGAAGGGLFSKAFAHSVKGMAWGKSAQNYNAVSKRVRRLRGATSDQELHHWFFPNGGWGNSIPNSIKNHPANLHSMNKAMHRSLHSGELGFWRGLNEGIPGWFSSLIGFAGGNFSGNALKPGCACAD